MSESLYPPLVCPVCKGPLIKDDEKREWVCLPCALAFPIKESIPVMIREFARELPLEEVESIRNAQKNP